MIPKKLQFPLAEYRCHYFLLLPYDVTHKEVEKFMEFVQGCRHKSATRDLLTMPLCDYHYNQVTRKLGPFLFINGLISFDGRFMVPEAYSTVKAVYEKRIKKERLKAEEREARTLRWAGLKAEMPFSVEEILETVRKMAKDIADIKKATLR